jgi:hypothetical protein
MARSAACCRAESLAIPLRHKRGGSDFVTDKNKQVTHDP